MSKESNSAGGGIGLGAVIAALISWTLYKSVLWALLHGICGWLYVLYWAIALKGKL